MKKTSIKLEPVQEKLKLTIDVVREIFESDLTYYNKVISGRLETLVKRPHHELGWVGEEIVRVSLEIEFLKKMLERTSYMEEALENEVEDMEKELLNYYPSRSTNTLINFIHEIKMEFYARKVRDIKKMLKELNS
jgi:hypothetical protein